MAQAHKAEWLSSFLLASVPQPGSLSLAINFQVYLLFCPRFVGSTEGGWSQWPLNTVTHPCFDIFAPSRIGR